MKLMVRFCAAFWLCACLSAMAWGDEPAEKPKSESPSAEEVQAEREAAFAKLLTGSTLVGHFTSGDGGKTGSPKEEKYTLTKVAKVQGDIWLFQTRIQYGDHDVTLPLPLPVKWAGDTPMIYLDNMPIPSLGTFSARVIFAEGKYVGTWSGKNHGGHLYGRIVPAESEAAPAEEKKSAE